MPQAISDDELNRLIASDPQIQQIIAGVWGNTPVGQRPGDTPKDLEKANGRASQQIQSVLESRGIKLPNHTFINPRSASVEHMKGWAGLPTAAKVAIIAGAAATGIGAAGALGAFGGAAGAAGGAGGGAAGAGGAAAAGAVPTAASIGGVTSGITGGVLPGTMVGGGAAGGSMTGAGFLNALKGGKSWTDLAGKAGSLIGAQQKGKAEGARETALVTQGQDRNAISRYEAEQRAQDEAARRDLDRQKYGSEEQGRNAKNALFSALLGGGMPRTSIDVPGIQSAKVSGGLLDALKNNPEALASLSMLKGQANKSLESGPTFTGGNLIKAPTLTPLPETGGAGNSFLNALSNIGQIVGGIEDPTKKKPPVNYGTT
jgi:hypothetical protein